MRPKNLALLLAVLWAGTATAQITDLDRIGDYNSFLGEGAAEISAHDPTSQRLFVVNAVQTSVDIVDVSDPTDLELVRSVDLSDLGGDANGVAVSGGLVAVAVEADDAQNPGLVVFLDTDGNRLGTVRVGALPDMVVFTPDGETLLVANEGEPNDEYTVDPEGTVSLVDLSGGVGVATVNTVGFGSFNEGAARAGELPAGVRIFGPGASVAQDLEPEYIALSPGGSTAFVSLQENNALAVIDVASATVTRIDALGTKDYATDHQLDPSNRDDGIEIAHWPVTGIRQPDAIDAYEIDGTVYVFTANEGDARDYDGFSEEARIGDLPLDPDVFPDAADLQRDENLGRLNSTTTLGDTDGDGLFEELYTYGGRSFSIFNGDTGELVFDSGDDFETITAVRTPALFNSQGDADSFDSRSDDKGPEPEAVVVGEVDGRIYAFVGLERIGGLMIYDVTEPADAFFVHYEPSSGGDLSPEGLLFVGADDSPSGEPVLIVSNEVSGNVSIYRIVRQGGGTGGGDPDRCSADADTLCLLDGRFRVEASFAVPDGASRQAGAVAQNDGSGYFWFFNPDNTEVTVKVVNACTPTFDRYWFFAAGMTNVEVRIAVTDTDTGATNFYSRPEGPLFETIADNGAFDTCP